MAVKGEILIQDQDGTLLEGPRENGSSLVFEFNHKVYLPYDQEENKIQGSRRITEFSVLKDIDRLTPQLYGMVCRGMLCKEVKISLYRIAMETGEEEVYFTYLLEDAKIVSVENWMPSTKLEVNENIGHLEKVRFLAKKFTWAFLEGGIEYTEEAFKPSS
ncbi:MAG: type VI secretion system tube protein Hcp [Cyclobacteriaceae bacterium]|nr:type VI secretion system tube protein Hcp [Cyclobacteriaceae bacterium]